MIGLKAAVIGLTLLIQGEPAEIPEPIEQVKLVQKLDECSEFYTEAKTTDGERSRIFKNAAKNCYEEYESAISYLMQLENKHDHNREELYRWNKSKKAICDGPGGSVITRASTPPSINCLPVRNAAKLPEPDISLSNRIQTTFTPLV